MIPTQAIAETFLTCKGNTPLIRVNSLSDALGVEILVRPLCCDGFMRVKPSGLYDAHRERQK